MQISFSHLLQQANHIAVKQLHVAGQSQWPLCILRHLTIQSPSCPIRQHHIWRHAAVNPTPELLRVMRGEQDSFWVKIDEGGIGSPPIQQRLQVTVQRDILFGSCSGKGQGHVVEKGLLRQFIHPPAWASCDHGQTVGDVSTARRSYPPLFLPALQYVPAILRKVSWCFIRFKLKFEASLKNNQIVRLTDRNPSIQVDPATLHHLCRQSHHSTLGLEEGRQNSQILSIVIACSCSLHPQSSQSAAVETKKPWFEAAEARMKSC